MSLEKHVKNLEKDLKILKRCYKDLGYFRCSHYCKKQGYNTVLLRCLVRWYYTKFPPYSQ